MGEILREKEVEEQETPKHSPQDAGSYREKGVSRVQCRKESGTTSRNESNSRNAPSARSINPGVACTGKNKRKQQTQKRRCTGRRNSSVSSDGPFKSLSTVENPAPMKEQQNGKRKQVGRKGT